MKSILLISVSLFLYMGLNNPLFGQKRITPFLYSTAAITINASQFSNENTLLAGWQGGGGILIGAGAHKLQLGVEATIDAGTGPELEFVDILGSKIGSTPTNIIEWGPRVHALYIWERPKWYVGAGLQSGFVLSYRQVVRINEIQGVGVGVDPIESAPIAYYRPLRLAVPIEAGINLGILRIFGRWDQGITSIARGVDNGFQVGTQTFRIGFKVMLGKDES
ncbi:MAG: hypothetical protein AAFQ83_04745 [Bacteroidota bacterium]